MNALPPKTQARIDDERRRLQQAAEVLTALAIVADRSPGEVDIGDVALVVRAMIDTVVTKLDSVSLERP